MKARILIVVCLCCVGVFAIGASPRAKRRSNKAQGVPAGWWTDGKGNWKTLPVHGEAIDKMAFAINNGGMMAPAAMMAPADAPAAPNSWTVTVSITVNQNLDPDDQALYQNMANILSTVAAPPPARLTEFAAAIGAGWVATPWIGNVTQVTPDGNGGNLVTVGIDGLFNDGDGNFLGQGSLGYSEQWDVDVNGNPTFVQSFDPLGMSAQLPPTIIN